MLLHSFYSFDYILKLPLWNITRLIIKAKEKENTNLMFTRWVMNYEGQVSFKEFKETLMAQSTTIVETEEETLDRIKNIMDAFNKKGGD